MAIVPLMEKIKLPKPASTRTTPKLQNDFRVAVQSLALSRKAQCFGEGPTMELTTNALWLWFARRSADEAESFLAEWFPRLEEALREEGVVVDRGAVGQAEVKVNPKAKKRNAGA